MFASYNSVDHTIDVVKGATSDRDTRDYKIYVYLEDDSKKVKLDNSRNGYLVGKKDYVFIIRVLNPLPIDWRKVEKEEALVKANIRAEGNMYKARAKYEVH